MKSKQDAKIPYDVRPEGTVGTLNQLAIKHRQLVGYFKWAYDSLHEKHPGIAANFTDLATFHNRLLVALNEVIADMPGGAFTPSKASESTLKAKYEMFESAALSQNIPQLNELVLESERDLSDSYRYALNNDKLLDFAKRLLSEQHEEVLEQVDRAQYFYTDPQPSARE